MKLKKILVNILVPLNSVSEINERITDKEIVDDVLGFHVVLTNKINKKFNCDFTINCGKEIFWSIDKKQTINKCLNVEYETQRCRVKIESNQEIEIYIWSDKNEFTLKSVNNTIPDQITELRTIELNEPNDKEFINMFGFKKKYHFDQYRKLLIQGLYQQKSPENERFVVEMVEKILYNSRSEREFEANCYSENDFVKFFNKVFRNLLEENCGTLDLFSEYRQKIISKLNHHIKPQNTETKIILGRNEPIQMTKKIDLTPKVEPKKESFMTSLFDNHEINKTYSYQNVFEDVFVVSEISRKKMFFEPQNSIIIFKYNDVRFQEIEQTIEKIVTNSTQESYEIIVYFNYSIDVFERIVKNHDNLFRIKIVSPKNRVVKAPNYSEIQKLIILSNMTSCINNHIFLVGVGCIFPKKYMGFVSSDLIKEIDKNDLVILSKCNIYNKSNGKLDFYETNTNKLFNYFVECMFPVIPKNMCKKLNFKSPIFGSMNSFKELKNFLMKNGTINNIVIYSKIPEDYIKEALHIFEG